MQENFSTKEWKTFIAKKIWSEKKKTLGSFRYAKDLDFGNEKLTVKEIKEKLGINDAKLFRFFSSTLKIFFNL